MEIKDRVLIVEDDNNIRKFIQTILEANDYDLDYVAASPVFSTTTKTNTIVEWGLDGLRWIRSVSRHPLVAIGGIHSNNVASIFKAGADSVAVISAIVSADDPERAARELLEKSGEPH